MIANQMRYETPIAFVYDIMCSIDPNFMAYKLINKYSDEILNLVHEQNIAEETEELKEELILRVNSLKVSSN